MRAKDILVKIAKFLVAGGLIYWLIQSGLLDLSKLTQVFQPIYVVLILLMSGANLLANHSRWVFLLRGQGFDRGIWSTVPLTLIGVFFNFAIPGAVGGDLVKAYYVTQDHPDQKMRAGMTVLMDRLLGLYSMMFLALTSLLVNFEVVLRSKALVTMTVGLGGAFVGANIILGLALSSRVRRHNLIDKLLGWLPDIVQRIYDTVQSYRNCPAYLAKAFLLSLCGQLTAVAIIMLVGHALGAVEVPWGAYLFAVPVGFIVSAVPLAPAGIGVGQVAFMMLFQMYLGFETQVGQAGITAIQLSFLCWGLLGAYFYMQRKKPVLDEVEA